MSPSIPNPLRRVESGVGRALLAVGGFLLATLMVAIVIGVVNSNLFWGEANQYARIDIPGAQTVHLPSGTTEATVAVALPGRGNETPELLLPPLDLDVIPIGEAEKATLRESLEPSVNANDSHDDTSRVVWKIDSASGGDYRVRIEGDMTGYGVNPQLWLGYQPGWVHGTEIWFVAMAIVAAAAAIIAAVAWLRRRRKKRPPEDPGGWIESGGTGSGDGHGESVETAAKKMAKLQREHASNGIGDAEFERRRAELEKEFMSERGLG
ncbi:MAG: hypothetical protein QM729_05405 [Solirubrobacterales bacterium]